MFNNVDLVAEGAAPSAHPNRALVLVGVDQREPSAPVPVVSLIAADPVTGEVRGGCLHLDRIETPRGQSGGGPRYYLYEVPPGSYVYRGSALRHEAGAINQSVHFEAAAGQFLYIGNVIFDGGGALLSRDFAQAAAAARKYQLDGLPDDRELREARAPHPFLCYF